MNRSPPILTNPSTYFHFCSSGLSKLTLPGQWLATRSQQMLCSSYGFGLVCRRKGRSHLKLVVNAELSRSGLDSQTLQTNNVSELHKIGPLPGDMAEVEAYCRILRAAENFMDMLCNPVTGEFMVSYDISQTDKPFIEDKIISVLGCLISLLNKGKEDVLCGRSLIISAFRAADQMGYQEGKLPPLAVFRNEIKHCCESLHVALGSFLMPDNNKSRDVWRRLQRLKNLSYDLGFPRRDDSPGHWLIANWEPVLLSNCMNDPISRECQVAFWKGGQMTEESLKRLLAEGFKTIVDLNEEIVKDNFYQLALGDAIKRGEVESFHLPVVIGTAPSLEKLEKFAFLVSDESKRPIYVHSRDGVLRTSAMISAWRQYLDHSGSQIVSNGILASALKRNQLGNVSSNKIEDELLKYDVELMQTHSDDRDTPNKEFSSEQLSLQKDGGRTVMIHNGTISCKAIAPEEVSEDEVQRTLSMDVNPLMFQLPPHNVFCRTDMSSFFKSRKISPPSFCSEQRVPLLPVSKVLYSYSNAKKISVNGHYEPLLGAPEVASSNGSSVRQVTQISPSQNVTIPTSDGHLVRNKVVNGSDNREFNMMKNDSSTCVRNIDNGGKNLSGPNTATDEDAKNNSQSSVLSDSEGLEQVEGNMCSSTTGVVRVQARKNTEIFLVRTDGFSCSRENVTESSLAFTHPSTQQQMLLWKSAPKTVLLLKKLGPELMEEAKEVASFLHYEENMNILVEPDVHDVLARIPGFGFVQTFYTQDTSDLHEKVDFVACLGGDGVILHASNLLGGAVPPVVSFNLGSLGFLTSHTFQEFKQDLRQIIHGNNTREGVYITLRMRLRCEIYRNGRAMPGKVFDVLNEAVVDRGSNPYLSKIECYEHGRLITKVQGDGVIVATPTGSTAYSTAAGGSMVHPNVPCMLFTPICPHSLSFRPVILPDSSQLELKIPEDARSNAWVSFDGKRRQQLCRGDSVKISMSQHPLPTVNKSDQTGDWFHSLIRCLNWNERLEQKAL